MPFRGEHSCRLRKPLKGAQTRRVNGARKHKGKAYDVIYQKQKDGDWEEQAYRYPKDTWDADEARKHCKDHKGILFEPAKEEKNGREEALIMDAMDRRKRFRKTRELT